MPRWNTDKFKTMKNSDLSDSIWNLWTQLVNSNKSVKIIHVYAHNKDNSANSKNPFKLFCHFYNTLADELAKIAKDLPDYEVRND